MHKEKYIVTPDIKGEILGVRTLQNRGRIQVPKKVRDILGLKDGDSIYWVQGLDGRLYIAKSFELR